MKTKLLLRFYFHSDGVDGAIDNLITAVACSPLDSRRAESDCERVIALLGCKDELAALWEYLDGVVARSRCDVAVLRAYCDGKGVGDIKKLKRELMRFRRGAAGAERFYGARELLRRYAVFCRGG